MASIFSMPNDCMLRIFDSVNDPLRLVITMSMTARDLRTAPLAWITTLPLGNDPKMLSTLGPHAAAFTNLRRLHFDNWKESDHVLYELVRSFVSGLPSLQSLDCPAAVLGAGFRCPLRSLLLSGGSQGSRYAPPATIPLITTQFPTLESLTISSPILLSGVKDELKALANLRSLDLPSAELSEAESLFGRLPTAQEAFRWISLHLPKCRWSYLLLGSFESQSVYANLRLSDEFLAECWDFGLGPDPGLLGRLFVMQGDWDLIRRRIQLVVSKGYLNLSGLGEYLPGVFRKLSDKPRGLADFFWTEVFPRLVDHLHTEDTLVAKQTIAHRLLTRMGKSGEVFSLVGVSEQVWLSLLANAKTCHFDVHHRYDGKPLSFFVLSQAVSDKLRELGLDLNARSDAGHPPESYILEQLCLYGWGEDYLHLDGPYLWKLFTRDREFFASNLMAIAAQSNIGVRRLANEVEVMTDLLAVVPHLQSYSALVRCYSLFGAMNLHLVANVPERKVLFLLYYATGDWDEFRKFLLTTSPTSVMDPRDGATFLHKLCWNSATVLTGRSMCLTRLIGDGQLKAGLSQGVADNQGRLPLWHWLHDAIHTGTELSIQLLEQLYKATSAWLSPVVDLNGRTAKDHSAAELATLTASRRRSLEPLLRNIPNWHKREALPSSAPGVPKGAELASTTSNSQATALDEVDMTDLL